MTRRSQLGSVLVALVSLSCTTVAHAHKPSDSYLTLDARERDPSGSWEIALRDLDRALKLDADGDGALTWGELRTREPELVGYALAHLTIQRGTTACSLTAGDLTLVEHSDGAYAHLPLAARCSTAAPLSLRYDLFFANAPVPTSGVASAAVDPQHRSVLRISTASRRDETFVVTAGRRVITLDAPPDSAVSTVPALVAQGVSHILSGLDHVLFLLALLLPSVLRRRGGDVATAPQIRRVLGDVVRVVTAFTVAHSLTLGLAALGLVNMSADVIEPAIAASVAIAAIDNLWPVFGGDRFSIAFVLGLLHGFGFSSALSDLGLHGAALLRGLLAFNVGVELGQLLLVGLFVPCAFLLRRARRWPEGVLRGGSLAIAAVALFWFCERVTGG